jgi:diguanylate cyclase (GGDEF)-like protein
MMLLRSCGLRVAHMFALSGGFVRRSRGESARGRGLTRFFVVSLCLVALMVGASLVAVEGHLRSQARYQRALSAQADAAGVQRAAILFWQEREAINEYLLLAEPSMISEIDGLQHAFDHALNESDPNPLHGEAAAGRSALAANDAFVSSFKRDESTNGLATNRAVGRLDKLGEMVDAPLEELVALHLVSVRKSERQASAAARNAFVGALTGGLLVLTLLGIFIAYVLQLIRDLRRQARQSERAALHDSLTDLPNRTLFYGRVEHEIRRCSRDPATFSILMFDLDRFKEINDTLGHSMGDLLLKQLGPRLAASLRPGDTLARISGDEFAVLLPGSVGATATEIATRILATLRQPFRVPIMNPRLSASIGIVTYPTHGDTAEALLQHADVALYQAKEHRNASAVYDYTRDPYNPARLALASDLDRAVANDEFELHYQPILDTHSLELVSVEALLRWQHPERGLLSPSEFISLAEHTGLIRQLTLLVLRKAICQAREWQEEGHTRPVSVNLSAANLLDTDLIRDLTSILETEGVSAPQLELEITETTIMTDPKRALTTLRELHAMGIRISIDDFGTGYSSLAYLRQLPVHKIKIDKSFVQQLARDDADAKIVRSTIELAHSLGFSVVAEGVEDQQALELLAAYGCDQVQGFHLCRPQPPARQASTSVPLKSRRLP